MFNKVIPMRDTPNNLSEMLNWGMISHFVYDQVKDLPFSEAKRRIFNDLGVQTWHYTESHFNEYLSVNEINIKDYAINDFISMILRATNGRVNPAEVGDYYNKKLYSLSIKPGQFVLISYDDVFLDSIVEVESYAEPNSTWVSGLIKTTKGAHYRGSAVLKIFNTREENQLALDLLKDYTQLERKHKLELSACRENIAKKLGIDL